MRFFVAGQHGEVERIDASSLKFTAHGTLLFYDDECRLPFAGQADGFWSSVSWVDKDNVRCTIRATDFGFQGVQA